VDLLEDATDLLAAIKDFDSKEALKTFFSKSNNGFSDWIYVSEFGFDP